MEGLGITPLASLDPVKDIYRSRRVFVTGHTGFKGSWLALWLIGLGAEVIGYSLEPPTTPNLFESIGLRDQLLHIRGDVRDYDRLLAAIQSHAPDLVFHLAAQSLVRPSYQEPRLTYETNVMGTVNVLEAVRHTPSVRVAINVTSDKCYENRESALGCREEDPMGGSDPYSSSKGCSELVTAAFLRSFFAPESYGKTHRVALASVRAGNVIGGGDWGADRLVPDCVRALSRQEEIVLRYPEAVRPWQHVLDPLSGYLLLGAKLWQDGSRYAGSWNLGPDDKVTWTVEEVVREIIRQWGEGGYRVDGSAHPHEAQFLKLDCRKANMHLGWRPHYAIREALSLGIDWYQRFYNQASPAELHRFTVGQIEQFQAASATADENAIQPATNSPRISNMTKISNLCRSCGGTDLQLVLSLGRTPLANALLTAEQLAQPEETYPLDFVFCPTCTLAQITETVAPEKLFREYLYFSSFSDTVLENARNLAEQLIARRHLDRIAWSWKSPAMMATCFRTTVAMPSRFWASSRRVISPGWRKSGVSLP